MRALHPPRLAFRRLTFHPGMCSTGCVRWIVMALAGRESERLFFPDVGLIADGDGGDFALIRRGHLSASKLCGVNWTA